MIRSGMGRLAAAVCALAALLCFSTPALAAPPQDDYDEVIAALGVEPQPSDYVVIVDTSGSMANEGRYEKVKSALDQLGRVLRPSDHVSVVTFDSTAVVRFEGEIKDDPSAIVRSLPAIPEGTATDIGLGIEEGLSQLERPGANEVGAIVLVTDGGLAAAKNSPYRKVGSAAWDGLRDRATELSRTQKIAPYAIALESTSDAKLLKEVFEGVIDVPADAIEKRMARIDTDLVKVQAAKVLEPDLTGTVEATWAADLIGLPPEGGTRPAEVTVRSTLTNVPLVLTDLGVTAGSLEATATGLPDSIELAPGQSVTLPLQVSWSGTGTGYLALTGTVTSPWEKVIEERLKLTFAPTITGSIPMSTAVPIDLSPVMPYLLGGLIALVAGILALVLWRLSRPKMVGSLAFTSGGAVVDEVLLDGRKVTLGAGAAGSPSGLTGSVRAIKRRNTETGVREPGVLVAVRSVKASEKARLFDGDSATMGGVEVTYTSVRTRMMSLINHAPPTAKPES